MSKGTTIGATQVQGMDTVMRNLNRELERVKGRTVEGMILASIEIRRDMENTSPLIPVDTGNLRSSWFTVTSTGKTKNASPTFKEPSGKSGVVTKLKALHTQAISESVSFLKGQAGLVMGFSANYAAPVHEGVTFQSAGNTQFKRPGSGAKFLESAIKRNFQKILSIIQKKAKIL